MDIKQLTLTERKSRESLIDVFRSISSIEYVQKLIDSLPYLGAIINEQRQIVFSNQYLLDFLGLEAFEKIIGKRPGEIVNCKNANIGPDGCGTSKNCVVCGALNSIYESQINNSRVTKECRISSISTGRNISYDFKVTSTPFEWHSQKYTLFALQDISAEKRRRSLEKIFFHDVLNKTSSIYGFLDLLKTEKEEKRIKQFIDILSTINKDLSDEIMAQRELAAAENNELKLHIEPLDALETINLMKKQIEGSEFAKDKSIEIDNESDQHTIETDPVLLKRTLTNMLKNALEASEQGDKVIIGVKNQDDSIRFWIKNNSVMPPEIKSQIFQRSFSTKSTNRGIGTYSMKILGENYLRGKVDFVSNEQDGTIFYIDLPLT